MEPSTIGHTFQGLVSSRHGLEIGELAEAPEQLPADYPVSQQPNLISG
jgi:hypothetical protein